MDKLIREQELKLAGLLNKRDKVKALINDPYSLEPQGNLYQRGPMSVKIVQFGSQQDQQDQHHLQDQQQDLPRQRRSTDFGGLYEVIPTNIAQSPYAIPPRKAMSDDLSNSQLENGEVNEPTYVETDFVENSNAKQTTQTVPSAPHSTPSSHQPSTHTTLQQHHHGSAGHPVQSTISDFSAGHTTARTKTRPPQLDMGGDDTIGSDRVFCQSTPPPPGMGSPVPTRRNKSLDVDSRLGRCVVRLLQRMASCARTYTTGALRHERLCSCTP